MASTAVPEASQPPLVTEAPTPTTSTTQQRPGYITFTNPTSSSTGYRWGDGRNREQSTQMYLFTFLATVALLTAVAVGLLWRAIYVRRRFHRQVAEAIARGEAIPHFRSPFVTRMPVRKKDPELGPMPKLWQNEMRLVDDAGRPVELKGEKAQGSRGLGGEEHGDAGWMEKDDTWNWLNPVSLQSITSTVPEASTPPPAAMPELPTLTAELREALRDMWPRRAPPPPVPEPPQPEVVIAMEPPVVGEPPDPGTEVRVGVLIAMPSEGGASRWTAVDPDEAEVPEVMLGVMECVVDGSRR